MLTTTQITTLENIGDDLRRDAYAILPREALNVPPDLFAHWEAIQAEYPLLPADEYLPNNQRYRFRRYSSFNFDPQTGALTLLPHQDYYQDVSINAVTGGMVRKFAPLTEETASNPFLHELIRFNFGQFPVAEYMMNGPWQVDAHQVRVVARPNVEGHPTPEGIHKDGAEFVTVHIAELENIEGGDVSIFDDEKNPLVSFRLDHVLDSYLFHDRMLWHAASPVRPAEGDWGVRSILTFDYHYKG